jgi:ferric-dicitrate binding protein FerR (iron transport regulator)
VCGCVWPGEHAHAVAGAAVLAHERRSSTPSQPNTTAHKQQHTVSSSAPRRRHPRRAIAGLLLGFLAAATHVGNVKRIK